MPQQEQLHKRKQRKQEEPATTFPETYRRASGGSGDGNEELLGDITELLSENEALQHRLGQLGIEAS